MRTLAGIVSVVVATLGISGSALYWQMQQDVEIGARLRAEELGRIEDAIESIERNTQAQQDVTRGIEQWIGERERREREAAERARRERIAAWCRAEGVPAERCPTELP